MSEEHYRVLHPEKYLRDYINQNIRPDGRELKDYRPIIVNLGSISTADGSALAKIGNTSVVCGIKAELCKPKDETPDEGFLIPNVELPPLCSPKFKSGPPSEEAQVLTQFVDDFIRNTQCVNLKDLCIHKDQLAWCLFVDLICLDFDGCAIDCCITALMAALRTVLLPEVKYDAILDTKCINVDNKKSLTIYSTPVSSSFCLFEGKVLIDPTVEEEDLSSGLLSITVKGNELCSVNKPGGEGISEEQLFYCIELAKKRAVEVEELIETALKTA